MGSIKDRNGMNLTEAEDIKNTQKNGTKKDLYDPDNHSGVIIHLDHSYPRMWSQVGLRKHHYEQY